jgi:uncharacterized protein YwqG
MSFLSKLFGRDSEPATPIRDVASMASALAMPAVQVLDTNETTRSWFLGEPELASGVAWPERKGKPLDFLACLDLAEIAAVQPTPWVPAAGSLSFFYDRKNQPAGTDPSDRDAWSVIYQSAPSSPRSDKSRRVTFRSIQTYPPAERAEVEALELSEKEFDAYCDLESAQTGCEYYHQFGGYPQLIQGDSLELDSQLASNGVSCGSAKAYRSERAKALSPGAADWRLLLQIASDDRDFMWGDAGNLYFMVRDADARAGRFDNVWLGWQCF